MDSSNRPLLRLVIFFLLAGAGCMWCQATLSNRSQSEIASLSPAGNAAAIVAVQSDVDDHVGPEGEAAHGAVTDDHIIGTTDDGKPKSLIGNLITLVMLVLLQVVLGFDNLLYISLESKRAPEDKQKAVRFWGIVIAIGLRIVLLFVLIHLIQLFQNTWFETPAFMAPYFDGHFNGHSLIVLAGGAFIIYTATKEVMHMMRLEHDDHGKPVKPRSVASVIFWIVAMNVVFSFDSILSAMALTDVFWVMGTAIVIGGVMMIWLADTVSEFLKKNRMYEVLGLFILFIVGVMLVSEGGHLAHLKFFGNAVEPMTKATFYFVLAVLVLVDVVQSRYQKKLMAQAVGPDHVTNV